MTGIYDFDRSILAVTGGTGAYANARGSATLEDVGDREALTLNLMP